LKYELKNVENNIAPNTFDTTAKTPVRDSKSDLTLPMPTINPTGDTNAYMDINLAISHYKKDEKGNPTSEIAYVPLEKEQLTRIDALIRQSIGFDQNRGDEVTVSNFEFQRQDGQTPAGKVQSFFDLYVVPFLPILKYLFAAVLLYIFYKKVIVPFMAKMLEETKEEELPAPRFA